MTSTHSLGNEVSGGNQADDGRRADGTTACPECSGRVTADRHESVCEDCGLVVGEQRIDHGPEWRSFADEDTNPERTGAPLTEARHDRGLSTEIGHKTDGNGKPLSGDKRAQLARLRRQHSRGRFQSKAERNLAYACSEIRRIASALGLGESVWEQACSLFRTAQHEDLVLGRSIESMAAASVYATCRCTGLVQPIEGVAELAQVDEGRVQNAYGVLNVELGLAALVQRPTDLVPWVADGCDAPNEVQCRALELAGIAEDTGIANGPKPSGVAAACIYRAAEECGWVVIQDVVADAANVTPVTLRARDGALEEAVSD